MNDMDFGNAAILIIFFSIVGISLYSEFCPKRWIKWRIKYKKNTYYVEYRPTLFGIIPMCWYMPLGDDLGDGEVECTYSTLEAAQEEVRMQKIPEKKHKTKIYKDV